MVTVTVIKSPINQTRPATPLITVENVNEPLRVRSVPFTGWTVGLCGFFIFAMNAFLFESVISGYG